MALRSGSNGTVRVVVGDKAKTSMHPSLSVHHQVAIDDSTELREVFSEASLIHTLRDVTNKELVVPDDSAFWPWDSTLRVDLLNAVRSLEFLQSELDTHDLAV